MIRQTHDPRGGAVQNAVSKKSSHLKLRPDCHQCTHHCQAFYLARSLVGIRIDDGLKAVRIQIAVQGLGRTF
jgi:hypothetical protein